MTGTQRQISTVDVQPQAEITSSDDVAALVRHLGLESFEYMDVASMNARERALAAWPLLAECHAWYENRR